MARRYEEARRERQALEKKVENLKAEVLRAEEAVRVAGSSEVIEKMAKEKLNLKKPEEQVVIVEPPKEIAPSRQQPAASGNFFLFRWLSGWFNFLKR